MDYALFSPKSTGWKAAERSDCYIEYMLYHLYADPFQHSNLTGRAEVKQITEELRERPAKRISEAGDQSPVIEPSFFSYV